MRRQRKRSVKREAGREPAVSTPEKRELTETESIALREIGTYAAMALLKEASPMPIQNYVTVLGVLYDCSPAAIREALQIHFPDQKIPALRTIQMQIRNGRELLIEKIQSFADPGGDTNE